jgi:transglutaminase-like putative cysteine protease
MNNRRHLGLVAAAATLLAAAPLASIFDKWTWLLQSVLAVALIAGAATLARALRAPVWAQVGTSALALLLALTWMFPSHQEFIGIIPTAGTFDYFGQLLSQSVTDMRELGVPVPDGDPLLFVTVLGVGFVAICVDLFTVGLRHPALAGLPMLAIYSVPVAVFTDSVPILPFMIGAGGFIWLLVSDNVDRVRRFGRRFTGDGRDVDVWEPSPLAAAGRRLAVVGVVLAVALPLAVPGMTTGLIDRFGTGAGGDGPGSGRGGSGSSVDLFANLSGQLKQDDVAELVKVRSNDPDPYYLRFGVADRLTPQGFASRRPTGQPASRSLPADVPQRAGVSEHRYHATVEVTGLNQNLLPVYLQPVNLRGADANWYYDDNKQVVYSNRARSKGKEYSFDYVRGDYSPTALSKARPLAPSDAIQSQYTTVEPIREIQDQVDALTAGEQTVYDKVKAIFNFFSRENGFTYSLEAESGTGGSAIVDFLTNKSGFCEQYAAAMAWLVRTAKIPARVAFGFTKGTQTDGDYTVLTTRNLHAWTEVYFSGFGWVPFDATPASSVPGSTDPIWALSPDAPQQSTNPNVPPGSDPSAAPGVTDPNDPTTRDPDQGLPAGGPAIKPNASNWAWWTIGLAVLVLALLALPALRRTLLRHRRQDVRAARRAGATVAPDLVAVDSRSGDRQILVVGDAAAAARADAHAAWEELLDTMVDFRLTVDPTETPRATAERLVRGERLEDVGRDAQAGGEIAARDAQAGGEMTAADGVRLLGRAEERARYARDPLSSEQLVRSLRTVRRAFARDAGRRTRIMAVLMPPSVLQRWRLAAMERSSRGVTVLARWWEMVSPRRLLPRRG